MTTITEGRLTFQFPAAWQVAKYDAWTFYVKQFQNVCGGAKSIDFLAMQGQECLWLIEVKDYGASEREKTIGLAEEFALKVRDTLAGLVAAQIQNSSQIEQAFARRALRCTTIKVVLHLEQPHKPSRLRPRIDTMILIRKLKQLLRPIDAHPRVVSLADGNKFGWDTTRV